MPKKEQKMISEGLHKTLILLFAAVILLMLLVKTVFL
jgi:hypothetical protein